jgi:heme-degrading monooxygenase HmoA
MIYEIALLPIQSQHVASFRDAFAEVAPLLSRAKGYRGHLLAQGVKTPQQFNLIVRWQSIEDHTPDFETSDDHRRFMMGLQAYFSGEPTVYHIDDAGLSADEHDDPNGAVGMGNSDALGFCR